MSLISNFMQACLTSIQLAYEMSTEIQKQYLVPNVPKIYQLKAASCEQGNLEVVEFLSKLMGLWNELENYIQVPIRKLGATKR